MLPVSKYLILCYKAIELHRLNPERRKPIVEGAFLLSPTLKDTASKIPEVAHTIAVLDEIYPEVKPHTVSTIVSKSLQKTDINFFGDINSLVSKRGSVKRRNGTGYLS